MAMQLLTAVSPPGSMAAAGGSAESGGHHSARLLWDNAFRELETAILEPLLESSEIQPGVREYLAPFAGWTANIEAELVRALGSAGAERFAAAMAESARALIGEQAEAQLGPKASRNLERSFMLAEIVQETALKAPNAWQHPELAGAASLLALRQLCLAAVVHHLAAGAGQPENAAALAQSCHDFAFQAYDECGRACVRLGMVSRLSQGGA